MANSTVIDASLSLQPFSAAGERGSWGSSFINRWNGSARPHTKHDALSVCSTCGLKTSQHEDESRPLQRHLPPTKRKRDCDRCDSFSFAHRASRSASVYRRRCRPPPEPRRIWFRVGPNQFCRIKSIETIDIILLAVSWACIYVDLQEGGPTMPSGWSTEVIGWRSLC